MMTEPQTSQGQPDHDIALQVDDDFVHLVDVPQLHAVASAVLQRLGVSSASLALVITDDDAVQELNRAYRGVDAPTDVLSFASHDQAAANNLPVELAELLARALGDVIIAYPYAARQAARFGVPTGAELCLLVVHGVLHLLGYDHATPEEEAVMWTIQEDVLVGFGFQGLSFRRYEE